MYIACTEKEEDAMNKEFYDYLRDKGFTDNGAKEVLQRFEEGREDQNDKYQLEQFNMKKGS